MKTNRGQKPGISLSKCVAFAITMLALIFSFQAKAFDEENPLEVKPNILWLSNDVNLSVFGDNAYDSFLGSGEVWYKKWGLSTQLLENDTNDIFGLPADSEYFNLDLKRQFGSKDGSNFELGFGWQALSIDSQLDASGPRVSLAGNLKVLKSFQVYGSTSYLPDLDDSINNNTATAYEIEAGFVYSPLPSLSLKAGYRIFDLDLDDTTVETLGSTSGFLLGSDWSW